jgi:hypothetical protein
VLEFKNDDDGDDDDDDDDDELPKMQVLWEVTLCLGCSSPYATTQHHMPEDLHHYQHHCGNLKSCMTCSFVPFK